MSRLNRSRNARRSVLQVRQLEDRSLPSSVQGTVFNDTNHNSVRDPGEAGVPGWTVYVDNNQDGIQNAGEASVVTGVAGDYSIDTTSITPADNGWDYFSLDLQVGSGGRWIPSTTQNVFAHPVNEPNAIRDFGVYFQPYSTVEPIGPEMPVNVTTTGAQSAVALDSDAAGNYVAAWRSSSSGIDTVAARVFNADGSPRTGEITVASGAGLGEPQVSMADNGRFAVGWSGNVAAYGKSSAYTRVYSWTGAPLTSAITVLAATSKAHNGVTGVAMDADGDFAVLVWQTNSVQTGNHWTFSNPLLVQRYTAAGTTNGALIQVDDDQTFYGAGPANIGMADDGRFVVVWHDAPGGANPGVYAQRYAANGQKSGSLMPVAVGSDYGIFSEASMNSAGQFAITWRQSVPSSPYNPTKLAVYQSDGVPIGPTQTVAMLDEQAVPCPIDDDGNVSVVWTTPSNSSSYYHREVYFRRVHSDGTLDPEFIVNTTTQGAQQTPTVAANGANSFVVAWEGNGPGDDQGIFSQRFAGTPPPPPPTTFYSIDDVSVVEGNSGTTMANFTVSLSAASSDTVTVQFLTANGTATSGSDFQSTGGTLTFAPGETSQVISVPIIGDRLGESDETFVVNLSNPVNAGITDGQGAGTIVDDEPRITITDVSMTEGNFGTKNFVFTVTLSAAYDQPVTLSYATANGTATSTGAQADYVAQSGALSFAAGETSKTITIAVKGDTKRESDETFFVNLTGNSSNSLLVDNQGLCTILNDD